MHYRNIGTTEISVSELSLGSWHTYSRLSFEAAVELVAEARSLGINFFDVAYYPETPHTEVIFGHVLRVLEVPRDEVVIADKVWYWFTDVDFDTQVRNSLNRLGIDQLDLVFAEHPRPGMRVADIAREMGEVVRSGKARAWGGLNWDAEQVAEAITSNTALGLPTPQIVQVKYSTVRRNVVESERFEELCRTHGVTIHASDTLEGGILAGRQPSREIGIDIGGIREAIHARVPLIEERALDLGVSMADFGLAYCLTNPNVSSLLFGATRLEHLRENVAAAELAHTRADELRAAAEGLGIDGNMMDPPYEYTDALDEKFVR